MAMNTIQSQIHDANQQLYKSRCDIAGMSTNRRLVLEFINTTTRKLRAYPKSAKVSKELDEARRAYIRLCDELSTAHAQHALIMQRLSQLQKQ